MKFILGAIAAVVVAGAGATAYIGITGNCPGGCLGGGDATAAPAAAPLAEQSPCDPAVPCFDAGPAAAAAEVPGSGCPLSAAQAECDSGSPCEAGMPACEKAAEKCCPTPCDDPSQCDDPGKCEAPAAPGGPSD